MRTHGDSSAEPRPTRRVLAHTADIGVEASAAGLAALVEQLCTGMFALMARVEPCVTIREVLVDVEAPNAEDLVVDTLAELLYLFETEDLLFCDFTAELIGTTNIRVRAGGVSTDGVELVGAPIKAVTYHDLHVEERNGGWYGRVYFDV